MAYARAAERGEREGTGSESGLMYLRSGDDDDGVVGVGGMVHFTLARFLGRRLCSEHDDANMATITRRKR